MFFSMAWLSLFAMFNLPTWMHHAPLVAAIVAAPFIMMVDHVSPTRSQVVVTLLGLPVMVSTLAIQDTEGALYSWSYVATIVALLGICRRRGVTLRLSIQYFFLVVLPEFIISSWIGPMARTERQDFEPTDYVPSLIPSAATHWHVHIGPWGETYHYSSFVGLVLTVVTGVALLRFKQRKALPLLLIGIYLIVFGGKFTTYLCLATVVGLYLVNRRRHRITASWLVILVGLIALYGADSVRDFVPTSDNEVASTLLRQYKTDITSGRQWLWNYHLRLFSDYPWTGVGLANMRFRIGTQIDGHRALASSESYYTQVFAAYGIWGASFILIHIYLVALLLKQRNIVKILCAGLIVIGTASASWFGSLYTPLPFFIMAFVCYAIDGPEVAEYGWGSVLTATRQRPH